MTESLEEAQQRRIEEKKTMAELKERGWKSTGDAPFIIAHSQEKKAGTIISHMHDFLERAVAMEPEEYSAENIKKVGRITYVSPDLFKKIEEEVKKHYSSGK